jgi:hypothetical protein
MWSLNEERVHWVNKINHMRRKRPDETAGVLEDLEMRRDAWMWEPSEEQQAELQQAVEGWSGAGSANRQTRRRRCAQKTTHHHRATGRWSRRSARSWATCPNSSR